MEREWRKGNYLWEDIHSDLLEELRSRNADKKTLVNRLMTVNEEKRDKDAIKLRSNGTYSWKIDSIVILKYFKQS